MTETRIIRKVEETEFKELIESYKKKIFVNQHAYFRLGDMQRKYIKMKH